jgi:hypothetical protein
MRGAVTRGDEPLIKQWMLDEAHDAGACSSRMVAYRAGQSLSSVTWPDAMWMADHTDIDARLPRPLWTYTQRGYGNGYGYGYGYGDGHGHGHGHGYGNGDGHGYGDGYGNGNGYGYGYGWGGATSSQNLTQS